MVNIKCVLDLFSAKQTVIVEKENQASLTINCFFDDLSTFLADFSSKYSNTTIYLSGATNEILNPIKEEILTKSQTDYSNNNIEVILV